MTTTTMPNPVRRSALFLAMLAVCFAAWQCTAEYSARNTNGNAVLSKVAVGSDASGSLSSSNSVISNIWGALTYLSCRRNGGCGAVEGGSAVHSHPVGNSSPALEKQTPDEGHKQLDPKTPVATTTNTNGELNNAEDSRGVTRGIPGFSGSLPSVPGAEGLDDNPARPVHPAPVAPPPVSGDPLPNSHNEDHVNHVNDADGRDTDALTGDGHDAAARAAAVGDHKSSGGETSGDLLFPRTENGSAAIPATTTTTTKPVTRDTNKGALTMGAPDGSNGSQSLSPTLQNATSHRTPAAKLTKAHTTAPAKSGVNEPSVKVTTINTSTNRAAQPAQEPAAANHPQQDTTQLQTLKSTTSTAASTDSKQTSVPSTSEFAKWEYTDSPTSLPKLSKALQSLDMKDSSIGSSAFFTLAALATFFVMAMAPTC